MILLPIKIVRGKSLKKHNRLPNSKITLHLYKYFIINNAFRKQREEIFPVRIEEIIYNKLDENKNFVKITRQINNIIALCADNKITLNNALLNNALSQTKILFEEINRICSLINMITYQQQK